VAKEFHILHTFFTSLSGKKAKFSTEEAITRLNYHSGKRRRPKEGQTSEERGRRGRRVESADKPIVRGDHQSNGAAESTHIPL